VHCKHSFQLSMSAAAPPVVVAVVGVTILGVAKTAERRQLLVVVVGSVLSCRSVPMVLLGIGPLLPTILAEDPHPDETVVPGIKEAKARTGLVSNSSNGTTTIKSRRRRRADTKDRRGTAAAAPLLLRIMALILRGVKKKKEKKKHENTAERKPKKREAEM
jgi:hypothetical protein